MTELREIMIEMISPSPYQVRKHFAPLALANLATSIARDGLVEPIVVREQHGGYELIVGERRWRAVHAIPGYHTILARVVEATDIQARRMNAAENMQREDLSPIETIEALVEVIDAEMIDEDGYAALDEGSINRVKALLMKLHADTQNETDYFINKFVNKIESVFAALPKPMGWTSFLIHDLPLITKIDLDVRQVAIEHKLNKSQTKALDDLKEDAPKSYERIVKTGVIDPIHDLRELPKLETIVNEDGEQETRVIVPEPIPLRDASARDMQRVRTYARAVRDEMLSPSRVVAHNWQTTLRAAEQDILTDVDRFKIILESIKREGGFERVTQQWLREDTAKFGSALIGFGEMIQQLGRQCLDLLEER